MNASLEDGGAPAKIGKYRLLEQIGKGGMGTVYKASAPDGSLVAIKILASHLTANEVQRTRFYQEARLAMRLDHPNIVRALEVGEEGGRHFLVMEYVPGENLGRRLKRMGVLPEKEAVRIITQVARALHKAHKEGLVHRDVKPDNILLTDNLEVKVADMGLAKELDTDLNLTRTGRGLGTPHFMAPEQFRNAKHADVRCDVYSMGATLYMMVTGQTPFRGTGPLDTFIKKSKNDYAPAEELVAGLSERTASVIRLAMAADPARRPPTARVFAELLIGKRTPTTTSVNSPMVYVIFDDRNGETQKIKGTPSAIRSRLRRGLVPREARASHARRGPYLPLTSMPEFKEFGGPDEARPRSQDTDSDMAAAAIESREFKSIPLEPDSEIEALPPEPFPYLVIGAFAAVALVVVMVVLLLVW